MIKKYNQTDFVSFLRQFENNRYLIRKIPIYYFECTLKDIQKSFKYISAYMLNEAKFNFISILISLSYNKNEVIIKELNEKMCHGYFQLDYMDREKYVPFIYEVNNCVSKNGCIIHYVSNIPNYMDSVLYFECSRNEFNTLKKIAENYNVQICTSKELIDFIYEQQYRQWDSEQYLPSMSIEEIEMLYLNKFRFKSNKRLPQLVPR